MNEETNSIDDNERVTSNGGRGSASDGKALSAVNTNSLVSVLTIRRPTREDSRVYVCKASNDFGWAEQKIRLSVKGMFCFDNKMHVSFVGFVCLLFSISNH